MATKNFTEFNTATPLTTSDYIVGYNAAGTAEIKTQVKDILDLIGDSDAQTLSFNEGNKNLTISSGNTISLSGLFDTTYQSNSGFYVQSRSTLETPTTGLSTVNNFVVLTQNTYNNLTAKLPSTLYFIVST